MPWLVAKGGLLEGRRFPLHTPCLVGRGPYNHVVLDDSRVSRQHAKISPESGGHVVYDLNSANGTFVNEVAVRRHRLALNDTVRFGPFSFRFESDDSEVHPPRKLIEVATLISANAPSEIIDSVAIELPSGQLPPGLHELEDADRKLKTLYHFVQAISRTLDTNVLIDQIVSTLFDVFPQAAHVCLYLGEEETDEVAPGLHARMARSRDGTPIRPAPIAASIFDEVILRKHAVLSAPPDGGTTRQGSTLDAPLVIDPAAGRRAAGLIRVQGMDRAARRFSQADLDLLRGIATQAGLALAHARMHQDVLRQERLRQDLLLAQEIQRSFLPRQIPRVPGIEFSTEYRPAYNVGGDFYDVFWLSPKTLGIFIGDVAGKGVAAALLMARISSELRMAALAERDPALTLERANRAILERAQSEVFVTGVYLTLDVETREIELANGGHLPPFVRRRARGTLERIDDGAGTAIGIFSDAAYDKTGLTLDRGDTLILCTDGIVEATNASGEQFGFERLEKSLERGASAAEELGASLLADVRAHVGDAPQYDDLTLVLCGISERPD